VRWHQKKTGLNRRGGDDAVPCIDPLPATFFQKEDPAGGSMKYLTLIIISLCLVSSSFAGDFAALTEKKKEKCAVCGMFVEPYADWNATIGFADAPPAIFDGSKDMFKYYLDRKKYDPAKNQDKVTIITVKDYYSKKDIDAFKASYVIWGDIYGPMGHEPIPFEKEADAKKFLKQQHGKMVLRFNDITLKLLHDLDNPE
jgi:copper chaperone NosL